MRPNETARRTSPVLLLLSVAVGISLGVAGCLTIEEMAPPVGPEFSKIAKSGVTLEILELGREVYVTDCARCHSVEPVDRYGADDWHDIIERMGPQSKLDASRTAALEAYVLAAHTVMTQRATDE